MEMVTEFWLVNRLSCWIFPGERVTRSCFNKDRIGDIVETLLVQIQGEAFSFLLIFNRESKWVFLSRGRGPDLTAFVETLAARETLNSSWRCVDNALFAWMMLMLY